MFSLQHERVVARDNTVSFANRTWQLEQLRGTLAGCRVTVHEHLDATLSITFGPHRVGRYDATGMTAVEMTPPRKATKPVASPRGLEKSGQKAA
ncbi:MAG: Transposase [Acidobacteria bacterium]|nr:Transposase [Acidobacteriota bacterium]